MADRLDDHERAIIDRAVAEGRITVYPANTWTEGLDGQHWMLQRDAASRKHRRFLRFEAAERKRARLERERLERMAAPQDLVAAE